MLMLNIYVLDNTWLYNVWCEKDCVAKLIEWGLNFVMNMNKFSATKSIINSNAWEI